MSPLYREDKLYFVKEQIKALESIEHGIDTAIFVFNTDDGESGLSLLGEAVNLINKIKKVKTKVLFRPNIDFSYGAWNDALKVYAKDFDYSFLIEDDYIPVTDNFEKKFIEYIENDDTNKTFYVCQFLWGSGTVDPTGNPKHPSIIDSHCGVSNGVILNSSYIELGPFRLDGARKDDYNKAQHNQVRFLIPFTDKNLKIASTADKYSVKFSNKIADKTYIPEIIQLGPEDGPELLQPAGVLGVTDWQKYEPRWTNGEGGEVSYEEWVLDPR